MPSFLDETTSPIFHDNSHILNFDPHNQLGIAAVEDPKAKGPSIEQQQRSSVIHEPFEETSNSSIHDSDTSDAAPMTSNGNVTRPTSMSSLPNGKSVSGGYDDRDFDDDSAQNTPRSSNVITNLPDRTAPRQALPNSTVNGVDSSAKATSSFYPIDASHNSLSSIGSFATERPPRRSSEQSKPALPTIPSDGLPSSQSQPFLSSTSPTNDHTPPKSPPHRLSSPPVYHGSTPNSSSNHLQPPHPGSTLKQRHTLEVPKLAPGRPSMDTAQSSGRFSPTVTSGTRRASLSLARRTTRSMQSDAPRDEIVPDEDAQRWAEAYRQKRASKRKRKEEEDDDRVLVGTKVDESHANWVTAYNMLTGIRVSVSRTNAKLDRELTDADFQVKQKSTFDM